MEKQNIRGLFNTKKWNQIMLEKYGLGLDALIQNR